MSERTWTGDELEKAISGLDARVLGLNGTQEFWLFLLKAWTKTKLNPNEHYSGALLAALIASSRGECVRAVLENINETEYPDRKAHGLLVSLESKSETPEELIRAVVEDLLKALRFFGHLQEGRLSLGEAT